MVRSPHGSPVKAAQPGIAADDHPSSLRSGGYSPLNSSIAGQSEIVMKSVLCVWLLVIVGSGCDPGWSYRVSSEPIVRDAAQPYHVGRISVDMFAGRISVDVDIRNVGKDPLEVDPRLLRLLDAQGRQIRRNAGPRGV